MSELDQEATIVTIETVEGSSRSAADSISIVPSIPLENSLMSAVSITDSGDYIEVASNVTPFASPPSSAFISEPFSLLYLTVATLIIHYKDHWPNVKRIAQTTFHIREAKPGSEIHDG